MADLTGQDAWKGQKQFSDALREILELHPLSATVWSVVGAHGFAQRERNIFLLASVAAANT